MTHDLTSRIIDAVRDTLKNHPPIVAGAGLLATHERVGNTFMVEVQVLGGYLQRFVTVTVEAP